MTATTASDRSTVPSGRLRRTAVVVLLVLSMLFLALGSVGVWAARTAFDSEVFTARVGALGSDPAVQTALATFLTEQVIEALDVEGYLESRLPPPADLLAAPLTGAVSTFVEEQVEKVLGTEAFANAWSTAVDKAHEAFVFVTTSDKSLADTSTGEIVVNLIPVIGLVLEDLTNVSPELVNNVTSTLDALANDPPAEAIAALEKATGITLPQGFGVITIDDGGTLGAVRDLIGFAKAGVVALIVLFVVCAAGALALSQRRQRTLVQFLATSAVVLAVLRQAAFVLDRELVNTVKDPVNRDAADAIVFAVMEGLLDLLGWLLLFVIVAAVAVWVLNRRDSVQAMFTTMRVPPGDWWRTPSPASLQIIAVIVAVEVLWWLPASLWLIVIVLVALVVTEVVLARSGSSLGEPTDGPDPDATGSDAPNVAAIDDGAGIS
jgi:hypothetical protein